MRHALIFAVAIVAIAMPSWLVAQSRTPATWKRGVEGQRQADLGNGQYLNPILAGDRPDPSVVRDGSDYYMVHSSFENYPGLLVWHSRDLVNWAPVGPALTTNVGVIWAPDIVKHNGRFYIYFPARRDGYRSNFVVWADRIEGPWSEPIDLKIPQIDPGHVVGEDGKRYLFLSAGMRVKLADDGLSVIGAPAKVYDGWKYPETWDVDGFALEGPKLLRHGDFFYMLSAEGGTAGPPTSHMVVVARSRSIDGPWENAPNNPVVRTVSRNEAWWSKGHATMVEGPGGQWYLVYHAYENGYWTLGRQTLLEPVRWTKDGWIEREGFDVGKPIPKPRGEAVPHGFALSDDFSTSKMGRQWNFYEGNAADAARVRYESGAMILRGKGVSPKDSAPLSFVAGDQAYEMTLELELGEGTTAGLLLFYNSRLYAGLGVSATNIVMHRSGTDRVLAKPAGLNRHVFLKLRNDRHIVGLWHSPDGANWTRFGTQMEVSGYHHNVMWDFRSLRPAVYAAGDGEVRFLDFKYQALR